MSSTYALSWIGLATATWSKSKIWARPAAGELFYLRNAPFLPQQRSGYETKDFLFKKTTLWCNITLGYFGLLILYFGEIKINNFRGDLTDVLATNNKHRTRHTAMFLFYLIHQFGHRKHCSLFFKKGDVYGIKASLKHCFHLGNKITDRQVANEMLVYSHDAAFLNDKHVLLLLWVEQSIDEMTMHWYFYSSYISSNYWFALERVSAGQCFFFSRNIDWVTPKIIYFYYLKKSFMDQSIQKILHLFLKTEAPLPGL